MEKIETREDVAAVVEAFGLSCKWVQEIAHSPDTWTIHLCPDIEWSMMLAMQLQDCVKYLATHSPNVAYRWREYIEPKIKKEKNIKYFIK